MSSKRRLYTYFEHDSAVQDAELLQMFKSFLETQRMSELYLFLDDHNNYLQIANKATSSKTLLARAGALGDLKVSADIMITRYIKTGSSRELNIKKEIKQEVIATFEKEKENLTSNLFENVVLEVTSQLRTSYQEFVRTDEFENYVTTAFTRRNEELTSPREVASSPNTDFLSSAKRTIGLRLGTWSTVNLKGSTPTHEQTQTHPQVQSQVQPQVQPQIPEEIKDDMKVVIKNLMEEVNKKKINHRI
jgi:hypothetical protein